jgi:hypothetical protein
VTAIAQSKTNLVIYNLIVKKFNKVISSLTCKLDDKTQHISSKSKLPKKTTSTKYKSQVKKSFATKSPLPMKVATEKKSRSPVDMPVPFQA